MQPEPQPKSILLVDDQPDILLVVQAYLSPLRKQMQEAGVSIATAKSYEDALQSIREKNIIAVISDISMPGKGGLDLLATLRESGIHLPFALLSAHDTLEHFREALVLGVIDFLSKPCDKEHLQALALFLMRYALAREQKSEELAQLRVERRNQILSALVRRSG